MKKTTQNSKCKNKSKLIDKQNKKFSTDKICIYIYILKKSGWLYLNEKWQKSQLLLTKRRYIYIMIKNVIVDEKKNEKNICI